MPGSPQMSLAPLTGGGKRRPRGPLAEELHQCKHSTCAIDPLARQLAWTACRPRSRTTERRWRRSSVPVKGQGPAAAGRGPEPPAGPTVGRPSVQVIQAMTTVHGQDNDPVVPLGLRRAGAAPRNSCAVRGALRGGGPACGEFSLLFLACPGVMNTVARPSQVGYPVPWRGASLASASSSLAAPCWSMARRSERALALRGARPC